MKNDSKVHVFGNQLTSEEKHKEERSKVGRLILGLMKILLIFRPDSVSDAVHNLVFDLPLSPAGVWMDVRSSDGQVSVCVSGCGLWAQTASSLFRNGGRVAVETRQHTFSIINGAVGARPVPALS